MQHYQDVLLDRSGNAIAGAIVTVVYNSTSLPADLYFDYAGTQPLTSIVTNADGSYSFYVSSGRYDYAFYKNGKLLKTETDVFIDQSTTLQDLSAPTGAALVGFNPAGTVSAPTVQTAIEELDTEKVGFTTLAATTGATLVGFKQTGTGSVTRTVDAKIKEQVCVLDFGADPTGVADSTAAFNAAAIAASGYEIHVPRGTYLITSAITTFSSWYLHSGSYISGLPDINPVVFGAYGVNDTIRLTGRVFDFVDDAHHIAGLRIGDSDPWLERNVRSFTELISEVTMLSPKGQIALTVGSQSIDDLPANYSTIGISAYGINNNTTNPEPTWCAYLEGRRSVGAGNLHDVEMDMVNYGSTFDLDPYTAIAPSSGVSVNCWLANGGGDVALGGKTNSAAITILPNPAKFLRGIVIRNGALDTTYNEAMTLPVGTKIAWYTSATVLNSYIDHRRLSLKTAATAAAAGAEQYSIRQRDSGAETASLDVVYRHDFIGCSGSSTNYSAGYIQSLQRTDFATGNARFSFDISARNTDGTSSQISLNGLANKSFAPYPTNDITLGAVGALWSNIYTTQITASSTIACKGILNTANSTELGDPATASTPFIDFHSSGNVIDYDCRIIASGGTSTVGQGTLTLNADTVTLAPAHLVILNVNAYANDAAAATGGVPVGGIYRIANALQIRLV